MPSVQDAIDAIGRADYAAARAACAELADRDPHARYLLASMIAFGQGGPADPAAAVPLYRLAADHGHNVARFALGALYAQGRGVPQDMAEALRWYTLAADGGYPDAMFRLGNMHAGGEGLPVDVDAAARWWEKAAAAGHPGAMRFLGRMYADGDGRPADVGLAAYWFFKAWQAGLDDAANDVVRVRAELEEAAAAGEPAAQNALGLVLCFGHGDPVAAFPWFEQAAERDHPEAVRMLGYLYGEGQAVPQDLARAAELYQRAAELGDGYAQFNFAAMIDQGLGGLTRDVSRAIRWFRKAADQGMTDAELRLAELLAERNRDRRDANEAVQRLWNVARMGPADAEYKIAAGDGSWAVVMKDRGATVAMPGLKPEELVGLPDD